MEYQMYDPVSDDLIPTLRKLLMGTPEETSGSNREEHLINFLAEVVRDYGMGDYTTAEVQAIFQKYPVPGFDILSWIKSKEEEGVYAPDEP